MWVWLWMEMLFGIMDLCNGRVNLELGGRADHLGHLETGEECRFIGR